MPPTEYTDTLSFVASVLHNTTGLPVPQLPLRDQFCPAEEARNYDDTGENKLRHLLRAVDAVWPVKGAPSTPTKRTSKTSSENGLGKVQRPTAHFQIEAEGLTLSFLSYNARNFV